MNELNNLLPNTANVLRQLAKLPLLGDYTFVGGSALAIYLAHRLSEDLDFFTWQAQIDPPQLAQQLRHAQIGELHIINLSPTQADFILKGVKLTFFANNWHELRQRTHLIDHLHIAQLDTLLVMKVNTLFLRAAYRDYYDLYCLNQGYTLDDFFELTRQKMNNLNKTLLQRALIFTDDIDDENIQHLEPKYPITLSQIAQHFQRQIKIWNKK